MKVVSFGEVLWDVYPDQKHLGGAPLNFAEQNKKHGLDAMLLSAVGADPLGKETLDAVAAHFPQVSMEGIVCTGNSGGGTTAPSQPEAGDKTENTETPETPATGEKFTDISNHAWAADAINALAEEGIIKGTSATTFSPANNITRADFALLLVRAFKLESDNAENFADISADDYFASEVAIARNNGIINGIGDNKFAPRNTITRQDMMTIVYRAMVKLGVELEKTTDAEMPDADSVAEYAKEAVDALIGAGLVNGKSGKIAPADYTTRAEVAVLIKRILDYTSK